jgi:hypothetical protein
VHGPMRVLLGEGGVKPGQRRAAEDQMLGDAELTGHH